MASTYEKLHLKKRELDKLSANGDSAAKSEKAKLAQELRSIERESARAGIVLNAVYKGDKVEVTSEQARSKRSMQEEYVFKFDGEKKVQVGGKEQTLQQYHRERLLK